MSEFSESAHLRSDNPKHAVDLLKRAKVAGFVFPSLAGWVSFVHAQDDADSRFRIEEANKGLLVFYDYAADHGCWVKVQDGKKPVALLRAPFEQPSPRFDRAKFIELGLCTPNGANEIEQWTKKAHLWHERSRAPHLVAERLGLKRYRWLAYKSELDREDPERIEVTSDGKVRAPTKIKPHTAPPSKKRKKQPTKKSATKKKSTKKPVKKKNSRR